MPGIKQTRLQAKLKSDSDFVWLDVCDMVPRIITCNRQNLQNSSRFRTIFFCRFTIDRIREIER